MGLDSRRGDSVLTVDDELEGLDDLLVGGVARLARVHAGVLLLDL